MAKHVSEWQQQPTVQSGKSAGPPARDNLIPMWPGEKCCGAETRVGQRVRYVGEHGDSWERHEAEQYGLKPGDEVIVLDKDVSHFKTELEVSTDLGPAILNSVLFEVIDEG